MAKGHKTGGGSRLGSPNKITAAVKEQIAAALQAVGGVDYLIAQASANPTAFLTLVGKLVPLQVDADVQHSYVLRAPERAKTTDEWRHHYAPTPSIQ